MRLALEHDNASQCETESGDLLSLGWSGLGKLVQIESLALVGTYFEEMAIAETSVGGGDEMGRGDAA